MYSGGSYGRKEAEMDCLVNGYVDEWFATALAGLAFVFGILVGVVIMLTDKAEG
jgi:hypothetical protein